MGRSRRSRNSSWSSLETMGSLPSPARTRSQSRDTGFPSSFDGIRNTTLPHPDADLSPNASISADDIAVQRVLSRTRQSFLAKHRRTISHGMITPEMERTYSELALLHENEPLSSIDTKRGGQSRLSKDMGASFASSAGPGTDSDTSPGSSPISARHHNLPHESGTAPKRRRSLLRRLMHR